MSSFSEANKSLCPDVDRQTEIKIQELLNWQRCRIAGHEYNDLKSRVSWGFFIKTAIELKDFKAEYV